MGFRWRQGLKYEMARWPEGISDSILGQRMDAKTLDSHHEGQLENTVCVGDLDLTGVVLAIQVESSNRSFESVTISPPSSPTCSHQKVNDIA